MPHTAFLLATAAMVTLVACKEKPDTTADTTVSVDIRADDAPGEGAKVTVDGDSDTGKFEIRLPGGIEAKVNMPEGVGGVDGERGKFDIDGVGLFPGAKVNNINVDASRARDAGKAVVTIGFAAPGDAAAVADWYQKQFEARNKAVTRSGETLSGTSDDGDTFTIAMQQAGTGASKGVLTITDTKRS